MQREHHVFFRPDEVKREATVIPATLYNQCRLLLAEAPFGSVFVPIRTLQFLAVITQKEIIFVDSLAYAVREGEGGRLILLAWEHPGAPRDSLTEPVNIDVTHYHVGLAEIQRRLLNEFAVATKQMLDRHHDALPKMDMRVVSIGG